MARTPNHGGHMLTKSLMCTALCFAVAVGGCVSPGNSLTVRGADTREDTFMVGSALASNAGASGKYTVALRSDDRRLTGQVYQFAPDAKLYRHVTRRGDYVEVHGPAGATFFPTARIIQLSERSQEGTETILNVQQLSLHRSPTTCTLMSPLIRTRTAQSITCDDPGPCPDCSGPMAPGSELACHIVRCGGDPDPDVNTGFGIGIFRSVDPQLSCYFNFADSTYSCDFDVENTESAAPLDLSAGYEFSPAMAGALLHCSGPPRKSEAFVGGKTPDGTVALGFHIVQQGRAVVHVMHTLWTTRTSMSALYFGTGFLNAPVSYVGSCVGAN